METPREFIKPSGKKESKKWVREHEESARKKFVEGGEKNAELEKLLQTIDFKLLKSLFEEVVKRTTLDFSGFNFLGLDRIAHKTEEGSDAEYFIGLNLIGFDFKRVKSAAEKIGFDVKLLLLRLLCHEEAHAVAKSICYGLRGIPAFQSLKSGLQEVSQSNWALLDEAVTEKLSGEVFIDYLRGNPDFATKDAVQKFHEKYAYAAIYSDAVKLLDTLTQRISRDSGMPEEEVWRGFVRSKLEGEDLWKTETKEFFDSVSPEFFKKLMKARFADLEILIEQLRQTQ